MSSTPGCFGSIIYHDPDTRRCGVCPLLEICKEETAKNQDLAKDWLQKLVATPKSQRKTRNLVHVGPEPIHSTTAAPSRARAAVATTGPNPATAHLGVKAREFVDRWTAKGIDFLAYKNGVNGFTGCGNKFATVAMQFFMDNPHGVTRMELVDELIKNAGARGPWGHGTAGSHANFVFEAFEYLGIVTITGGKAYLR